MTLGRFSPNLPSFQGIPHSVFEVGVGENGRLSEPPSGTHPHPNDVARESIEVGIRRNDGPTTGPQLPGLSAARRAWTRIVGCRHS